MKINSILKRKHLFSIGVIFSITLSHCTVVKADPVTVNITGRIIASACTVDSGTINQTVDFERVIASDFPSIGSAGSWKDFSLSLSSCPASTTKVEGTFSGNSDDNDQTKYANSGTGTGLALQVSSRDHQEDFGPNSTMTESVNSSNQTVVFPLSARLVKVTDQIGSGTFRSEVLVTFSYQ